MFLDSTSLKLEAVLAGAITTNQPEVHVFYKVWNNKTTDTRPETYRTALNSTTDVTILSAPTIAGTAKQITGLYIYNKDTVAATVTVKTDDGTTERIIIKQELLTTETLSWTPDAGWFII